MVKRLALALFFVFVASPFYILLTAQWDVRFNMPGRYPYYKHLGAGVTSEKVIPPGKVYGVNFLRTGTDTITVWYFTTPNDSMSDKIPPAVDGGPVTVTDQLFGPIFTTGGYRIEKASASEIIIRGGCDSK